MDKNYFSIGHRHCPWTNTYRSLEDISKECKRMSQRLQQDDCDYHEREEAILYDRMREIVESALGAMDDEVWVFKKISDQKESLLDSNPPTPVYQPDDPNLKENDHG